MAHSFGTPITVNVTQPYTWCIKVAMPDGTQVTISIEQQAVGPAVLVVRTENEMLIRPIAANTIGIVPT